MNNGYNGFEKPKITLFRRPPQVKSSKEQIHAKFHKIPTIRFEDQQIASFSALVCWFIDYCLSKKQHDYNKRNLIILCNVRGISLKPPIHILELEILSSLWCLAFRVCAQERSFPWIFRTLMLLPVSSGSLKKENETDSSLCQKSSVKPWNSISINPNNTGDRFLLQSVANVSLSEACRIYSTVGALNFIRILFYQLIIVLGIHYLAPLHWVSNHGSPNSTTPGWFVMWCKTPGASNRAGLGMLWHLLCSHHFRNLKY